MDLLTAEEWRAAEAFAGIGYCNPFLPQRVELERTILGAEYSLNRTVVSRQPGATLDEMFPHLGALRSRAQRLTDTLRDGIIRGAVTGDRDLRLYEDLALYLLYNRYMSPLDQIIFERDISAGKPFPQWKQFLRDYEHYLRPPGVTLPFPFEPGHVLACFYQIERAFHQIFDFLIGESRPIAELRAAVWQSIFTHDMRRYARGLYNQMHTVSTLVTGPSGTGKELVAQAIGLAGYVKFDPVTNSFPTQDEALFRGVNLAALAPTLIESELFGHTRGAFSGAVADREGRLESKDDRTTVFLDEVGELTAEIQVKLLRVLQTREFERVGEFGTPRQFRGRLVAATNRDLTAEMRAGRFREDFYFRLCADTVRTPGLREQLADQPGDLGRIVQFVVDKVLKDLPGEAERLCAEVVTWIESHLGLEYPWPGNIRELEQCVRNIMVRGHYRPPGLASTSKALPARQRFAQEVAASVLTEKELLRHYHSLVYTEAGTYKAAAKRLDVDWRTVREKVDPQLVESFHAAETPTSNDSPAAAASHQPSSAGGSGRSAG